MDLKLSEFIAKTSCEPGFAQDLLNHHDWNLAAALKCFYRINNMLIEKNSDLNENIESVHHQNQKNSNKNPGNCDFSEINNHNSNKDVFLVGNKCTSEPSLSSQSSDACDSSNISSPTKLTSFRLKRNEMFLDKKLSRGISRASDNENLISKARFEVAQDFKTSSRGSRLLNLDKLLETPDFTFTLPDINSYQEDFCEFLKRDLIEKSTLSTLESSKRLNWWSEICHNLYPLVTSGDGNCLLHAASLGMWGFHDRELILRKALHILLSNSSYTRAFYRRWRWQTHFQNSKTGLSFSEKEWEQEWENIVRMASTEPRSKNYNDSTVVNETGGGKKQTDEYEEKSYIYESLEEIHIFVLAHVLRRPIIVIADTMLKDSKGEAFFPILFGGIYLPLECPDDCLMKSPLCLTFESAHFSALVAMNKEKNPVELPLAIPLTDFDHNILPLHFAIDPGEVFDGKKPQPTNDETVTVTANDNNTNMDDLAKTFVLTEQDKIELLKKYFDLLTLAHKKENCIEKEVEITKAPKIIEKSQTLPSDFGRKNDFQYDLNDKYKTKNLLLRSTAKQLLQKPLVSFGRMSKCIKKNLGHLARRSTSFRLVKFNNGSNNSDHSGGNSNNKNEKTIENRNGSAYLVVDNNVNNKNDTANNYYKESIINTENSIFYCDTNVLAAKLYTNKKHLYYEEMIKNYLTTARVRFVNERQQKKLKEELAAAAAASAATQTSITSLASTTTTTSSSSSSSLSSENSTKTSSNDSNVAINDPDHDQLKCVNIGCKSNATSSTNYLCSSCFDEQKKVLLINGYGNANNNDFKESTKNENELKFDNDSKSTDPAILKNSVESNEIETKNDEGNKIKPIKEGEIDETKIKLKEISFDDNRNDYCITNM